MLFKKFLGNTHIPHRKNTADMPPIKMDRVSSVLLPVSQHIGSPAEPVVKVGDTVKVGELIAKATSPVSSPVYASISGRVTAIESYMRSDGRVTPAIRIEGDGLMTLSENITPPDIKDLDGLIEAARMSGLVGLGGAGFPTAIKLDALRKGNIDTVVINAAECEPYITCDTRTMLDDGEWLWRGIGLLHTFCPQIKCFIFGIEKNKPKCISAMRELFGRDASVRVIPLPSLYPQGAEKVIVYNTTKRVIPEGKLPADVGVLVINVTSLATIAKYVSTGIPLVERVITLDGDCVKEPKNILAPIGVSVGELIEFGGGLKEKAGKVLFGGPMMGTAVCSLSEPIIKTTGAVTVFTEKSSQNPEETACIHCGRCVSACPMGLNPTEYSKALDLENKEDRIARLEKYKVGLCIECGCCSYVCPANRPLVQNNRLAKGELREHRAHSSMLKK